MKKHEIAKKIIVLTTQKQRHLKGGTNVQNENDIVIEDLDSF